jgi:ribosomal protein S18 acetylase RimI-like enzyme
VGPFRGFVWPHGDDYLMSFATSVGAAPADWAPHIDALQHAFSGRGRRLRLEFFEQLHPTLAPALKAAGLERRKSAVAMALARDAFHPMLKITGGTYTPVDENNLEEFFLAHNEAFGMAPERVQHWLPLMRRSVREKTMMAAADYVGGRPVCGATLLLGAGTAELAGVWTRRDRRGRGLAGDVCSRLLNDYFEFATSAWLSTDAAAGGLYSRLGFVPVGTQLNFG